LLGWGGELRVLGHGYLLLVYCLSTVRG
jgi:hypothetical protein